MKKAFVIIVSLIVVLFLAILIAPKILTSDAAKAKIAAMVKASTGRELQINGDIHLALFPDLEFSVADLHLSNAPGMAEPEMLSIAALSGKVQLMPLLSRRLVVDSLVISQPVVNLGVDKNGRPNWVFGKTTPSAGHGSSESRPASSGGELPISDLTLGEIKISQGNFSFIDARSGQTIRAQETSFALLLPNLASPLALELRSNVNDQQVSVDLSVDSLKNLLQEGLPGTVHAALTSKYISTGYQGSVQLKPVPGLNGAYNLDIPSVGQLAAWLGKPLDASQPDPGPLNVRADFVGNGLKVALQEAVIEGNLLKARATGSYDGSGEIAKLALTVESEALDIDSYLPSPAPATETKNEETPKVQKASASKDPLAALSDKPFDLSGLRKTEVDIKITIAGIKALGYKIGRIVFTTSLADGLLTADLQELNLYGGTVKANVTLDGSTNDLGVSAAFDLDRLEVDDLARTAIGDAVALQGTADGNLTVNGKGLSPKGLVESISAKGEFNLGGIDLKNDKAGDISAIHAELDLPGSESKSLVQGSLVYNKEPVNLALTLDSIKKAIAGEVFSITTSLETRHLNLTYNGTAQGQPAPGLAGSLTLDVASVARLLQWLEQPLGSDQPDPGPLAVRATVEAQEAKAALKEATIEGKAILVHASASADASGAVPELLARISVEKADLDAYLPPAEEKKAPKKKQPQETTAKEEPGGWSEEPLDLSGLSLANADILVEIGSIHYREITVEPGRIKAVLKNGVLDAALEEIHVADGVIDSTVKLDGSGESLGLEYQVAISGLKAMPFLKTFANTDRLSGQTAFQASGTGQGGNQKELVDSLQGNGQFSFRDGAIHGVNIAATLRKVKSLGFEDEGGEEVQTDFAELSGSYLITDGVLENQDLKMLAPLLNLAGSGQVPLPERSVTYDLTAELVASLEGQGRKDSLSGLPIPIHVEGPWEQVSYKVDWGQVFGNLATDPARLQNLPQNLRDAGSSFGVDLSVPNLSEGLNVNEAGAAAGLLNQLLPGTEKSSSDNTTATGAEKAEEPAVPDPGAILKGLFGR